MSDLTPRQKRMLRALSGSWEPARDIAERAEVDIKAAGAVLASLYHKRLVQAKPIWVEGAKGERYVDRCLWRLEVASTREYVQMQDELITLEVQVRSLKEALREICNRSPVERNPDGVDQAAHTMQLIARDALAALEAGKEARTHE